MFMTSMNSCEVNETPRSVWICSGIPNLRTQCSMTSAAMVLASKSSTGTVTRYLVKLSCMVRIWHTDRFLYIVRLRGPTVSMHSFCPK